MTLADDSSYRGNYMKFLLFADLHHFESTNLNKITDDFDVIIFLGDINALTMKEILNTFPSKPSYAILGNHDSERLFDSVNNQLKTEKGFTQQSFEFPVKNINCIKVDLNEISFTGLQGSIKYKDKQIGYTQKEALLLNMPR